MSASPTTSTPRRLRSDGARSRQAILKGATELATLDGLEGLSIGRLADHIGMSKSGLYAHFGSKEELQLATIDAAQEIFDREVGEPTGEHPAGIGQLLAFCDAYLSYLERGVFPGGCFFASAGAELDTHEGRVRDKLRELMGAGMTELAGMVREAQARGELDRRRRSRSARLRDRRPAPRRQRAASSCSAAIESLERARRGVRERLGRP